MKITLNHAGNGDCILIESNGSAILIDGGTASSYTSWKKVVLEKEKLDALVVTHIDNDHINGIIRLLEDPKAPDIEQVFYNGSEQVLGLSWSDASSKDDENLTALAAKFSKTNDEVQIGASEGTSLSYLLKSKGIKYNSKAISNETNDQLEVGSFSIKVIGPTLESLNKLRFTWLDVLDEEGIQRRILNKSHSTAFEAYVSELTNDYLVDISHEENTNIEALANYIYTRDTSITNESSLVLLIKSDNKLVLKMGDCHVETIISWLDKNSIDILELDAIKLSHHGSKNNINVDFLQRINCNKFLISTNGKKFKHPDLETIAIISKNFPHAEIIINERIEHITEDFVKSVYEYNNVKLVQGIKEINI
ncbi:ComEC/Rec2 family competence protein [Vibrio vulnificus]|uniref:ComEC/Rec2 family competence protein n=1 Tax=Vibrio vulnificus TaxID=672 RepID=UPI0019D4140A|nr:MBL fold metallo-hydrolase [Vibrio vulnificus]MBN8094790.1 MBL fold metallo-hydrolase [Vibrio vulnificus]HAS6052353.1 MBL fold metallo-hydrolase [Vibrio vulnificus]